MPETPEFVQRMKQAYESLDPEKLADLFSDETRFVAEGQEMRMGRDQVRELAQLGLGAIDSADVEVKRAYQRGPEVAMLVHADVAFKEDYAWAGITFPTGGKTLHADAAIFATLDENGRAKEMIRVRDNWQIMKDLGMSADDMREIERAVYGSLGAQTRRETA